MRDCQESAVVYMLQSGFGNAATEVINIMDALKESMQAKGRAKLRDAVRRRMGEA
jgi:non-homologous end joining protein Ku